MFGVEAYSATVKTTVQKTQELELVHHLIELLKDEVPGVRAEAAISLGQVTRDAGQAMPALEAALRDKDATVRSVAAGSLARLGRINRPPVDALVRAWRDHIDRVAAG